MITIITKKRAWGACEILRKDQWNVKNVPLLWRPKINSFKCVTVQVSLASYDVWTSFVLLLCNSDLNEVECLGSHHEYNHSSWYCSGTLLTRVGQEFRWR